MMAKITFIEHNGKKHEVDAAPDQSVMEAAVQHLVPGIVAECTGSCSCATCHVYVDEAWVDRTGEPSEMEEDMLDFAVDVKDTSRLSCQIRMSDELDGLVVRVPENQY